MARRWVVRLTVLASSLALAACGDQNAASPAPPAFDLRNALAGGDTAGFARATEPPRLEFPRDHGPHEAFRTEWWYWTGNVATDAGRAFGFELVFFRQALAPPGAPPRAASLASREVVLAHAALTDVDGRRFRFAERSLRRDGVRAGTELGSGRLQLWCGDWTATATAGGDGFVPMQLQAGGSEFAFELELGPGKPLVLHGDAGRSPKSSAPGNASIYYSATRLPCRGVVTLSGRRFDVAGLAWCDREWSTSALGDGQVGWDWFSLQLDDGTELMWYRLRFAAGTEDPHSQGTFVSVDGVARRLLAGDLRATPRGEWRAPDGRAVYPAAWHLAAPSLALDVDVTPRVADQELRTSVRYWEGAVTVRGTRSGANVAGSGYLEMTGYAK